MNNFVILFLCSLLGLSVYSASNQKRTHNHGPEWLYHCWDEGAGHIKDPFCDLLTTTETPTTTTPPPTTTTTEPTTTTTEPTTTTTEPTTTTTEPTTTTTTLPPTTTERHCEYEVYNDSSISETDYADKQDNIQNTNQTLNQTVHSTQDLATCQSVCASSLLSDNFECWAFTYSTADKCRLYYYFRRLKFVPKDLNITGTTLYLKRCSDDPFPGQTRSTSASSVITGSPSTAGPAPVSSVTSTTTTRTVTVPVPVTPSTSPPRPQNNTRPPVVVTGSGSTSAGAVTNIGTRTVPGMTNTGPPVIVTNTGPPVIVTNTGPPVIVTNTGPSIIVTGGTAGTTTGNSGAPVLRPAPGGVVMISSNTFRINGVPSLVPDTCFFLNKTFSLNDNWMDTCKYNCTCVDTNANAATCTDICPIYTTFPSNCKIVKDPAKCCSELECTNATTSATPTAPVNGSDCDDENDTCNYYPDSACKGDTVPWARAHCPLRCDFCPGKAPPCVDKVSYCERYDLDDACKNYEGWARSNCMHSCNRCTVPGWNPEGVNRGTTSTAPPPIVST